MGQARLLLVDDEERVLRSLEVVFRDLYDVHLTTQPLQALEWIEQQAFDVVVCDQRMPTMSGVNLLREIRKRSPLTARLLLTGYADIPAIVASINEGEIHRYIHKPWEPVALLRTVAQAVELSGQLRWLAGGKQTTARNQTVPVLVYDEDPQISARIIELAGPRFAVTATAELEPALEFIAQHPVPVLITEVQMGGVETLSVIRSLKSACPDLIVIVLAVQQDAGVLIRLVNQCQIFRFLHKPLGPQRLQEALHAAAALHDRLLAQSARIHPALPPEAASQSEAAAELAPLSQRIADYFRRRA